MCLIKKPFTTTSAKEMLNCSVWSLKQLRLVQCFVIFMEEKLNVHKIDRMVRFHSQILHKGPDEPGNCLAVNRNEFVSIGVTQDIVALAWRNTKFAS